MISTFALNVGKDWWKIMKKPKCKKCGYEMTIDKWNGWRWRCFRCDIFGRSATDKEIEEMEAENDNTKRNKT